MKNFPGEGVLYSGNSTGGGVSGSWKFQGGYCSSDLVRHQFTNCCLLNSLKTL